MMTRSRDFLAGMLVASVAMLMPSSVVDVYAAHSTPITPHFFDLDNDGIPEIVNDSQVKYNKGGGEWTTSTTARANEAMIAWSSQTDFNPGFVTTLQVNDVYVDGREPATVSNNQCPSAYNTWAEIGDGDPTLAYAVNCYYRGSLRQGGPNPLYGYYRLQESNIFMNTNNQVFYWGTLQTVRPNGRGVLTHELGHSILLEDVYPPPYGTESCGSTVITMCGVVSDGLTYNLYSLTNDDITGANGVYE
jgi:hypothetical protein